MLGELGVSGGWRWLLKKLVCSVWGWSQSAIGGGDRIKASLFCKGGIPNVGGITVLAHRMSI